MTREEAIQVLKEISATLKSWNGFTEYPQAIDMAIEVLSEPSVVRCKDCKWYKKIVEKSKSGLCHYDLVAMCLHDEDFCSHGERQCNYFGERREP